MIKIKFTSLATPISDFKAEGEVKTFLAVAEMYQDFSKVYSIYVCNILVWMMLRAALYSTHKHLIDGKTVTLSKYSKIYNKGVEGSPNNTTNEYQIQ